MNNDLLKEHRWYEENRAVLVAKHHGRFLVVTGCAVAGDYATEAEAMAAAVKTHPLGSFLIKHCVPVSEEKPLVFHSRVVFA